MSNPCETCAFGKSGGAADEIKNRMKADICAFGGIPFFCHHTRSGEEYDWHGPTAAGFYALPRVERKVCAGWQGKVRELKRHGYFDKFRIIRRAAARQAIDDLAIYTASDVPMDEREAARRSLWRCFKFIVARSIGRRKLPFR